MLMSSAPPSVDAFQVVVDVSQIAGAVIGVAALIVALRARSGARRDLAKERRTVYELDLLRRFYDSLNRVLHAPASPEGQAELFTHLLLLPDTDDLPMTRAAIGANSTWVHDANFKNKYPVAPAYDNTDETALQRLKCVLDDGVLIAEYFNSVYRRVDSRVRMDAIASTTPVRRDPEAAALLPHHRSRS